MSPKFPVLKRTIFIGNKKKSEKFYFPQREKMHFIILDYKKF